METDTCLAHGTVSLPRQLWYSWSSLWQPHTSQCFITGRHWHHIYLYLGLAFEIFELHFIGIWYIQSNSLQMAYKCKVYVRSTIIDIQQQELHSWNALHLAWTGSSGKWGVLRTWDQLTKMPKMMYCNFNLKGKKLYTISTLSLEDKGIWCDSQQFCLHTHKFKLP